LTSVIPQAQAEGCCAQKEAPNGRLREWELSCAPAPQHGSPQAASPQNFLRLYLKGKCRYRHPAFRVQHYNHKNIIKSKKIVKNFYILNLSKIFALKFTNIL
jgi:hypothetical protein